MQSDKLDRVAIVGAGVSGLTCAVLFAEHGYPTTVFARDIIQGTTSAAAAAIWFPYDAEPAEQVVAWSLETLDVLRKLARDPASGVDIVELRVFARRGILPAPGWAHPLGARSLEPPDVVPPAFSSGYSVEVPVADTTLYLDYLRDRAARAGAIFQQRTLASLGEVPASCNVVVNCSGIGARSLARDENIEAHRGQVAVIAKLAVPYAVVCDDPPLMYAIPRRNDCVLGGTNDISENLEPSAGQTRRIVAEAARVLEMDVPTDAMERVGLRPFRRAGIRVEREELADGRTVIHNYGHGGSGFTLAWGCAHAVLAVHEQRTGILTTNSPRAKPLATGTSRCCRISRQS